MPQPDKPNKTSPNQEKTASSTQDSPPSDPLSHTLSLSDTPSLPITQSLLDHLIEDTLKRYRSTPEQAREAFLKEIQKRPDFIQLLHENPSLKRLKKHKRYNEIKTAARKNLYYSLRQYNAEDRQAELLKMLKYKRNRDAASPPMDIPEIFEALTQTHASTRERAPHKADFYAPLQFLNEDYFSIVDVGCGLHPLQFPFEAFPRLLNYQAFDKDPKVLPILEDFRKKRIPKKFEAYTWNISEGWSRASGLAGQFHWGVAFMLKLIPVVHRIEPQLLDILAKTPAHQWVISCSKFSLTKKEDISHRERKVIHQFLQKANKKTLLEYETGDELVWIVT